MATLTPLITASGTYPYSWGEAETYSYVPIINDAGRPLFAKATYIANPKDLNFQLSATNINISSGIKIVDGTDGTTAADVVTTGSNKALRVLTQDFDSVHDSVSIGDKSGNFATVNSSTSSLNVSIVSSPTSFYQFNNFGYAPSHNGWQVKDALIPMFAVRVKPNQNITAKIEEYEIGCTNTNAAIGYVWYENPAVTGLSGSWVDLNSYLQYAIFTDTTGTENGITGGTTRHSGILIGKNSTSEVELSEIPLTGGSSPNVLALAVRRLDNATSVDLWFAVTLGI